MNVADKLRERNIRDPDVERMRGTQPYVFRELLPSLAHCFGIRCVDVPLHEDPLSWDPGCSPCADFKTRGVQDRSPRSNLARTFAIGVSGLWNRERAQSKRHPER
jgi:hypothetical protein